MFLAPDLLAYSTIIDLLQDRSSSSINRSMADDAKSAIDLLCQVDIFTMKGYKCWYDDSVHHYVIQGTFCRFAKLNGHFITDYSEVIGDIDKAQLGKLPFGLYERSYDILCSFTKARQINLQDGLAWAMAYAILEEEGELLMRKGRKVRRITSPPSF